MDVHGRSLAAPWLRGKVRAEKSQRTWLRRCSPTQSEYSFHRDPAVFEYNHAASLPTLGAHFAGLSMSQPPELRAGAYATVLAGHLWPDELPREARKTTF